MGTRQIRWLLIALGVGVAALGLMAPRAQAEPVNFKELMPLLDVKIPGWEMAEKPSGMTVKQGSIQLSEARAKFRTGDRTLEITILDYQGLPMPWAMQQMEMETAEEQIRAGQLLGYKALEIFRKQDKHAELNLSVADRFWVRLEGEGLDGLEPLKAAAQSLDLKKLAALAK
jgi:hypothetical protein